MLSDFKVIKCFALLVCLFSLQQVFAVDSEDILGVWATPNSVEGNAHIEITKENQRYLGKIIWLEQGLYTKNNSDGGIEGSPLLDKRNPVVDKRSRPLLGLSMLQGFTFKKNRWLGGTIYDPESGKTYKCKISIKRDGTLKVRGFIGVSMLGRTSIWTKLSGSE